MLRAMRVAQAAACASSRAALLARPTAAVGLRGIQLTAFDLRAGDLIEFGENNELWRVSSFMFSRQAQGRAFMQLELRHLKSSTKKEVRMRTDEVVEKAVLDTPQKLQVLYWDATTVSLMDPNSFEQIELPVAALGESARFLQEGQEVRVENYKGAPTVITMPSKVVLEVTEVVPLPPGTAKDNRDIPGVLANGVRIRLPKFTRPGDKVVVDTETGEYLGKAEK